MDTELLLIILVDGLVYASYLFMVSVGLTVICGVQKILNVTHGSLYAFGAYLCATMLIFYAETGWPGAGAFVIMVLTAIFLGVVFGSSSSAGCSGFSMPRTSTSSCSRPSPRS